MSPCLGGGHAVLRVANAGGNHLGGQFIVLKYINNIFYHLHAVIADVIQSADKGANIGGTSQRCEKRLVYRET